MSDLRKTTVNLTPRSVAALDLAVATAGDTPTDTINRALQVYAELVEMGEHEGVYRVTLRYVSGRPLYLRVSRQPWRRWLPW